MIHELSIFSQQFSMVKIGSFKKIAGLSADFGWIKFSMAIYGETERLKKIVSERKKKVWLSVGIWNYLYLIRVKGIGSWTKWLTKREKVDRFFICYHYYFPSFGRFILLVVGGCGGGGGGGGNRFRLILIVARRVDATSSEVWLDSFTRDHVSPQDWAPFVEYDLMAVGAR